MMQSTLLKKMAIILASLLFVSCGDDNSNRSNQNPGIDLTRSSPIPTLDEVEHVTFFYSVMNDESASEPFSKHAVIIESREKIKLILGSIKVIKGERMKFTGMLPYGFVDFVRKDGKTVSTFFVKNNQLDVSQWGQLYVGDELYKLACEYSSAAERRPIDVLKLNE